MKKYIKLLFLVIICFIIIFFSSELVQSIKFSFDICFNNLFPSFIPFMLLSNILLHYDLVDELNDIFKSLMKKFKVSDNVAFIFFMSIFSGTPSNATYINQSLNRNLIDIEDANKSLKFCHFLNPLFIITTIGYQFLNSKSLGLKILFSHYISNIIIGLTNKSKIQSHKKNVTNYYKKSNSNDNFFSILKMSIITVINTLTLMLGVITFFLMITTLLNKFLNINSNYKFIYGLIEITQGLKYLSNSNLSITLKALISSFLVSFGGLCIHIQTFCIIDNKKIRYLPYLLTRLIHGIISMFITYIIIQY